MSRPRQKGLPLSRAQRIQTLKAIDYRSFEPTLTRRQWANVLDLLIQVECCSGRNGTHASLETLASRMRERTGLSTRTARRASQYAQAVGLLGVESGGGQNVYRVIWDRAVALSRLDAESLGPAEPESPKPLDDHGHGVREQRLAPVSRPGTSPTDPGQNVTDPGQVVRDPGQNGRSYIRNNLPITSQEPPPPSPSSDAAAWSVEEEDLLRLGMRAAKAAVRSAKAAGCSLADWLPHKRYWEANQSRWREPLGVLAHRLETLRPGQPPEQGWPRGDDRAEASASRSQKLDRYDRERAARKQWRAAGADKRRQILVASGLDPPEARRLLSNRPGDAERCGVEFMAPRLHRSTAPTTE